MAIKTTKTLYFKLDESAMLRERSFTGAGSWCWYFDLLVDEVFWQMEPLAQERRKLATSCVLCSDSPRFSFKVSLHSMFEVIKVKQM